MGEREKQLRERVRAEFDKKKKRKGEVAGRGHISECSVWLIHTVRSNYWHGCLVHCNIPTDVRVCMCVRSVESEANHCGTQSDI